MHKKDISMTIMGTRMTKKGSGMTIKGIWTAEKCIGMTIKCTRITKKIARQLKGSVNAMPETSVFPSLQCLRQVFTQASSA